MLRAVETALDLGEFVIPTENPAALRLRFNGLRGALRRKGDPSKIDAVSFHLQASPPALVIRPLADAPLLKDVDAALSALSGDKTAEPSAAAQAEDLLARLLGGSSPTP
jgi:hypothetical protein